jgi:tRNA (guanine6-N2)-methyltransferase
MPIPFFALATRGLEPLVQAELRQIDGVRIRSLAYRRVRGAMAGKLGLLAGTRTADDIFLEVAAWEDVRHTRDMLAEFAERAAALDLGSAIDRLKSVRRLPQPLTFAVTANFVGKRNYTSQEIKAAIAEGVLRHHPAWTYAEDDREAGVNVRVFIEHQHALVGIRLTEAPLHRRAYKQQSLLGSLKPPVAAAMVQLAGLARGETLLDPFCGSGTIPIEAAHLGLAAIGGDGDLHALQISRNNARHAGASVGLIAWQAEHLPLPAGCVQAVVSNLPWGKQVTVASLGALYRRAYAELRRVLTPGGVLVLLTTLPELLPDSPAQALEVSVHGQNPQLMVFR